MTESNRNETAPEDPAGSEYARRLGAHLRNVRKQRGLSLTEVERLSEGEYKASVLGAYERGERSISVPRLARLAECYGVTLEELLPPEDGKAAPSEYVQSPDQSITLDLDALESSLDAEAQIIERYVNRIRIERGAVDEGEVTIRREDVRVMSAFLDMAEDEFVRRLHDLGIVVQRQIANSQA
jgi:transcriptional regulator with XRE-family HTH domain